jgi:hypothetical protein
MTTGDQDFSAKQSLDLIQSMIRQAQGNVQRNSFYFLLWGWIVTSANFGMYGLMKFTDYPYPYIVWLLTIPAWIITMVHGARESKSATPRTHLDKVTMWLWICYGLSILPFVFFMNEIRFNINPAILIVTAVPTFLSGILVKFRPLLFGGVNFYILGIVAFMVSPVDQYLVGGIAVVCGYLIPGYLLRATKEKENV